MGASWSSNTGRHNAGPNQSFHVENCHKKQRIEQQWQSLIPGLPDELSMQILSRASRSAHPFMRMVCSLWNRVLNGDEIYTLRHDLGVSEQWLYVLIKEKDEELTWFAMDPLSSQWTRLPPMPGVSPRTPRPGSGLLGFVRSVFRRKDNTQQTPFFGCTAAELDGCLYVLGGFINSSATTSVGKYDPRRNSWSQAGPMSTPRAYCKTGLLNGKLYVVGGVNRGRNGLTPLHTAEVYDPVTDTWTDIPSMPFIGAQVLPGAFVTDILKPIATGLAAFRGKLWVPQSLYSWPFFMDIGGEVYDPVEREWTEMPRGMGDGWPARQAGMKLSVVVDGSLYSLDPMSSMEGSIKVYDFDRDVWRIVVKKVPLSLNTVTDSESPYLLVCLRDKLHIVSKDASNRVVVLRAEIRGSSSVNGGSSSSNNRSPMNDWSLVAAKSFGRVELVTCQVVEI